MKCIVVLILAFMLAISACIGEENMDYRIIGGRGRIICGDIELVREIGGEVICTIPDGVKVVLMGEKSDGSHTLVNYEGQTGFVPAENVDMQMGIGGMGLNKVLTPDDWYNISSFITTFTRAYLTASGNGYFSTQTATDAQLVTFALDHTRLADISGAEFGEYENGFNVRISDSGIGETISAYFNRNVSDITQAEYRAWSDGYFYYEETGGFVSGPFAIVDHVSDMGNGSYRVRFNTFAGGNEWTDEDISLSAPEASEKYPDSMGYGYAEFSASDLSDPATYRLTEMALVN